MAVMMRCGHAANGELNGQAVCVICYGIVPGADEVVAAPDLQGRVARCNYFGAVVPDKNECDVCTRGGRCHCEEPSSTDLAFFEYRPEQAFDAFFCGCHGWD